MKLNVTALSINETSDELQKIKLGESDTKLKFTPSINDFGFVVTLLDEKWLINTSQYKSMIEENKEYSRIITNKNVALCAIENNKFAYGIVSDEEVINCAIYNGYDFYH